MSLRLHLKMASLRVIKQCWYHESQATPEDGIPPCYQTMLISWVSGYTWRWHSSVLSNDTDIMSLRLHLEMAFLRVIKQCWYPESQATPEDGIPPCYQTMPISWVSGYTWRWHSSVLSNNADIMSLRLHLKMAFLHFFKQCWYHESQATPEDGIPPCYQTMLISWVSGYTWIWHSSVLSNNADIMSLRLHLNMAFLRVIKQCWYHESQATPEDGIPPCYRTMLISWVSGYTWRWHSSVLSNNADIMSLRLHLEMAFLHVIKQCWYHESQATPEDGIPPCYQTMLISWVSGYTWRWHSSVLSNNADIMSLRLHLKMAFLHVIKKCWYHESQATPEDGIPPCYQTMLISWVSGYTWRWHSSVLSNNADIMSLRLHLKMAFLRLIKQCWYHESQATPEDGIPPCYQTMLISWVSGYTWRWHSSVLSNDPDIMSLRLHLEMAFLRVIKQCWYHESQATPEDGIPPCYQTMPISWVSGYTWRWHSSVLSNNADIMSLRLHLKMAFLHVIKQCRYHESQATPGDGIPPCYWTMLISWVSGYTWRWHSSVLSNNADIMSLRLHLEMALLHVIKQCWYHQSQATPEDGIPPCYQTMLISWVSGYTWRWHSSVISNNTDIMSVRLHLKMAFLRDIKQCWYHESQATPEDGISQCITQCWYHESQATPEDGIPPCIKQCWYHECQATLEDGIPQCIKQWESQAHDISVITQLISWVSGYTWRCHLQV